MRCALFAASMERLHAHAAMGCHTARVAPDVLACAAGCGRLQVNTPTHQATWQSNGNNNMCTALTERKCMVLCAFSSMLFNFSLLPAAAAALADAGGGVRP